MRRVVAIAFVVTSGGLSGCADDSGGPTVAPPPAPALKAEGPAKAAGAPGARPSRGTVSTRPEVQAGGMKTALP